jgi:spore photoproduct lyase
MAHMEKHLLSKALTKEDYTYLNNLAQQYKFSFQQMRFLIETAVDLSLWQMGPLSDYIDENVKPNLSGKPKIKAIIEDLNAKILAIKSEPTKYDDFKAPINKESKSVTLELSNNDKLLGSCPCPSSGEKNRCCNLLTLDAVKQCAYGCSYCSIQSFYNNDKVIFTKDLAKRLDSLELPAGSWHIGTGQASDSLMWANKYGLLDALVDFANKHKEVVIELKTKSGRTDYLEEITFAPNIIATWSLNGPTIVEKEEHGTSSVYKRIEAAAKASEKGIPIGFHFHPMVYYENWEQEYKTIVDRIVELFEPSQLIMLSMGTLTFSKESLKQLRLSGQKSRILQMPLVEAAGKYSYPLELKEKLFKTLYNYFPLKWRQDENLFFYLCMELPQLWKPVFGYEYESNAQFEIAMKNSYLNSLKRNFGL